MTAASLFNGHRYHGRRSVSARELLFCAGVLLGCADGSSSKGPGDTTTTTDPSTPAGGTNTEGPGQSDPNLPVGSDADAATDVPGNPGASIPKTVDPGTGPWKPVPKDAVASECGLDPALLEAADRQLNLRWGIVRHGKLCHEFYPGMDTTETTDHVFSVSKTLGAVVVGRVIDATKDLAKKGPGTGPFGEFDRVDHWLDVSTTSFDIHKDARIAHVLAMVAYSNDLSVGKKAHSYDADGSREINALSNILTNAIAQDKTRFGKDLEEFAQRFVYEPLGLKNSTWNDGKPEKIFAYSWRANIRDMLRVGLLINNGGVWNGKRLLPLDYVYNVIHPAFEDGNTGYGYLTWLNGADHRPPVVGQFITSPGPSDACAPLAIHRAYPHGISESPDCGYKSSPYTCEQMFDVGAWSAQGLNGNYIYGHRGLDLVIAIQNYGTINLVDGLWKIVRPALVKLDPKFKGDDAAFCKAYGANEYAPDLKLWQGGL